MEAESEQDCRWPLEGRECKDMHFPLELYQLLDLGSFRAATLVALCCSSHRKLIHTLQKDSVCF